MLSFFKIKVAALVGALTCVFPTMVLANPVNPDCVVLLHGLARTSASMESMSQALQGQGYVVVNHDYPSRDHNVQDLAQLTIPKALAGCPEQAEKVHIVTHSLGGILVREYLQATPIPKLGRVVMLGPPNQGSEVVDRYRNVPGFKLLNGPAGMQLGTDPQSVPASLGPANFTLGVIAGTKTFNPILSLSLPNPDDGKVSLERTKVEGMTDFIAVPHTHTFMMDAELVVEQVLHFLAHAKFRRDSTDS